jgi:indolepyruvate ferredoxin oxidoreductase alpha subunit
MDMMVDMGAAIGMGLGLRHVLPEDQARRVVSVIGDSTFIHSGLTGIAEMVYNRPPTGHVVVILDNLTTAMTGHQEHPGTGRTLDHGRAGRVVLEDAVRGLGIPHVEVMDPVRGDFEGVLRSALDRRDLTVIVARRACLLIAGKIRQYEAAAKEGECKTA